MIHRHLTSSSWTRMEIESLFDRGTLDDWREFTAAIRRDRTIAVEALRVCEYREPDGAEGMARALVGHVHPDLVLRPDVERGRDRT